jgi:hypothetical protein
LLAFGNVRLATADADAPWFFVTPPSKGRISLHMSFVITTSSKSLTDIDSKELTVTFTGSLLPVSRL